MEYEREYLNWKKRQLVLQQKYADTPPGISRAQAAEEEERQGLAWTDYEERRRSCLTTAVQLSEESFAGRRGELAVLHGLFAGGTNAVFLSGMGGIGKSALARAYGRVYGQEYDQILLWNCGSRLDWIFADDGQLGISNLIYTKGGYRSRRAYAREKYRALERIAASRPILIILDNYNRMKDPWLARVMRLPCHLLVTTRVSVPALSARGYAALEVQPLATAGEWLEFYQIYSGGVPEGPEREAIERYRESVLGHTLKMKLALCSFGQLTEDREQLRSILGGFRLRKGQVRMLCELSFIALQGIPEEVYLACTEGSEEGLRELKRYCLVQERKEPDGRVFLSLHPVIEEAVRNLWRPDEDRCWRFLQEFSFYIRHSWNRPREWDLWLTPQVFAFLKRLARPVARRFYLHECLATYLMEWEYFEEAEQIERQLYECVSGYYGESHQYTAQIAMRLAAVLHNQMRFEDSREWYHLGYRLYKEAQPVDRSYWADRAEACEKLARLYEHDGSYEEALAYTEEAMEAARAFRRDAEGTVEKIWMDKRMRLQYIYLRRARLYFGMGDMERARRDLEEGMGLFPLNPFQQIEFRMLQIRMDLLQGEYARAAKTAALNLETAVYYQGESFKDSLSCREQMGDVLSALGEIQGANREYIKVLSCLQEKYPHQKEWMEGLRKKLGGERS